MVKWMIVDVPDYRNISYVSSNEANSQAMLGYTNTSHLFLFFSVFSVSIISILPGND